MIIVFVGYYLVSTAPATLPLGQGESGWRDGYNNKKAWSSAPCFLVALYVVSYREVYFT